MLEGYIFNFMQLIYLIFSRLSDWHTEFLKKKC